MRFAQVPKSDGFSGPPGPGEMTTASISWSAIRRFQSRSVLDTTSGWNPQTFETSWLRLNVKESSLSTISTLIEAEPFSRMPARGEASQRPAAPRTHQGPRSRPVPVIK